MKTNKFKWLIGMLTAVILVMSLLVITGCKKPKTPPEVAPTSIEFIDAKAQIYENETIKIVAKVLPDDAAQDVVWTSNNPEIAMISDGYVTGVSAGVTIISAASSKNPSVNKSLTVEVVSATLAINNKKDLYVGQKYQATIASNYYQVANIEWFSSAPTIATIDNSGMITCLAKGVTDITAKVKNTDISTTVRFVVFNVPETLTINSVTNKVFVDNKIQLKVKTTPSASLTAVTWKSSDDTIATIDENGIVIGNNPGVVTISATSLANPALISTYDVTVSLAPESVSITSDVTSNYIGETIQLSSAVYPSSVTQDVVWSSSDESIAIVDQNGLVTFVNRGDVHIFATSALKDDVEGSIKLTGVHELLELADSDVKYIITGPGEDASTSINITYHAKNTLTSVEYTLAEDTAFANATTITGNGTYFEELSTELTAPFEARNIYRIEITGLTPGTKYIYRVNKGDNTYSDTYAFTTANNADNFSFLWLTDVHYYCLADGSSNGAEISEQTIAKALELRPELGFVLETGDIVDIGGNSNIWNKMFEKRLSYRQLPLIGSPGNHEYYVNGTGQWDHRFFAAYNASPQNGPEGQIGSTSYFIYNDVLFIQFDNQKKTYYDAQIAWVENLLRTNSDVKLVIASMHAPIQSENAQNIQDRDTLLMSIFEKYGVDLVLTGHYHTDQVVRNYYEGVASTDPLLGVNYMIGAGGGLKGVGANADEAAKFAKGYIVDVNGTTITVTMIDARGETINSRTFNTIKGQPSEVADHQELLDSIKYSVNTSKETITFKWDSKMYGNAERITIKETIRNKEAAEVYLITPSYTKAVLNNLSDGYDFRYEVVIYFKDGTTLENVFDVSLKNGINLEASNVATTTASLSFDSAGTKLQYIIKEYKVLINNVVVDSTNYLEGGKPLTSYDLSNLTSNTKYKVTLIAYDYQGNHIFSDSVEFTTK